MVVRILAVVVAEHGKKISVNDSMSMRCVYSMNMLMRWVKMQSGQEKTY